MGCKVNARKFLIIGKLVLILLIGLLLYKNLMGPGNNDEISSPSWALGEEDPNILEMSNDLANPELDYSLLIRNNFYTGTTGRILINPNTRGTDFAQSGAEISDLALLGTICVSNQDLSRVVIKNLENQKISPYKIGDYVCGARILSIEDDKVILLHQGRERTLPIRSDESISVQAVSMQNETAQNETAQNETLEKPMNEAPIETTAGRIAILLKQANIEEYSIDEQTKGLKFSGLENIPFAERIGLKDGDIVTEVNGHKLTSKSKAYQVFKKARSQSKLIVQLLRDGTTKKLVFDLR